MSASAILAIGGFVALFGLVIGVGLRQARGLEGCLRRKVERDGWVYAPDERLRAQADWRWLASLARTRDVAVERLAVAPGSALGESAFTLATRRYGGRAGAARHVGVGLTTPLPSVIAPPLLATPVPPGGLASSLKWFLGVDLPEVAPAEPALATRWSIYSDDPDAAAALLDEGRGIATTLEALFYAVWNETRFQFLLIELNGDVAALIGGPKVVGRQPFDDLEVLARRLDERLR